MDVADLYARFNTVTRLWYAQLTSSEWDSLIDAIHLRSPSERGGVLAGGSSELRLSRLRSVRQQQPVSGRSLRFLYGPIPNSTPDSWIWFEDPAGKILREAALLGSNGYQEACAALLPYLNMLGASSEATNIQIGDQAADMLALLIDTHGMTSGPERADLYQRLFSGSLGLRPARRLLHELRHDVKRLQPLDAVNIVAAAYPFSWLNTTAFIDIFCYLNAKGNKRVLLDKFSGFTAEKVGNLLHAFMMIPLSQIPFNSANPRDLADFANLLGVCDSLVVNDPLEEIRVALNLSAPTDHILQEKPGGLEMNSCVVLLAIRDLFDLPDISAVADLASGQYFITVMLPLVEMAMWARMAEQGFPEPRLYDHQWGDNNMVERVNAALPEFIPRVRQLMTDYKDRDIFLDLERRG